MLREAAYLGIPAYSLFQGELGAVDRHLETDRPRVSRALGGEVDRIVIESAPTRFGLYERTPRFPKEIARPRAGHGLWPDESPEPLR